MNFKLHANFWRETLPVLFIIAAPISTKPRSLPRYSEMWEIELTMPRTPISCIRNVEWFKRLPVNSISPRNSPTSPPPQIMIPQVTLRFVARPYYCMSRARSMHSIPVDEKDFAGTISALKKSKLTLFFFQRTKSQLLGYPGEKSWPYLSIWQYHQPNSGSHWMISMLGVKKYPNISVCRKMMRKISLIIRDKGAMIMRLKKQLATTLTLPIKVASPNHSTRHIR